MVVLPLEAFTIQKANERKIYNTVHTGYCDYKKAVKLQKEDRGQELPGKGLFK